MAMKLRSVSKRTHPPGVFFFHVSGPVFFASDSSGNIASGGPCGVHVSFYNSPHLQSFPSLPFIFLHILLIYFSIPTERSVLIVALPPSRLGQRRNPRIKVAFIYIDTSAAIPAGSWPPAAAAGSICNYICFNLGIRN